MENSFIRFFCNLFLSVTNLIPNQWVNKIIGTIFFLKIIFQLCLSFIKERAFPSIRFNFEAIFYKNKTQFSPQPVPPIRKCVQDYYPHRSEGWPKRQELQSHSLRKSHNHRMIKWITALSWQRGLYSSIKLWAMQCRAIQHGQVMVQSSDKLWSNGEGNGKLLQYFCLKTPMYSMKRQKDMTLEDEPLRSVWYWGRAEK